MKLNKLHWLSALAAFALISGFIVHLIASADDVPQNPTYTMSSLPNIDDPKVNSQVTAVTMKLAELQSQVLRLNALGDRLAEEASIPDNEFNFEQSPPSGGPMIDSNDNKQESLDELLHNITTLGETLGHEEKQLKMLESVSFGHHIENTRYLSGRPITKGWLSSYFGIRKDPFNGKPSMHKGVDFAGSENADIIATASGVVSWAGDRYGYGKLIEINHGDGLKTRYGHNKVVKVSVGDVVNKGQVIAKMGSTGRSTGPHVHYEILRNNRQIDPKKFVYRKAKQ
ncbi:M23 family metallopeptidase [Colwellia sp. BRX10-3]|uniref:M23 family metallopeptidase n=1 Tax=Colwellia sp. BRX10-3 TaxID=2759844 RepID=UPI0021752E0B|nr:M23 family metallopeptidase [Colwellia sp. BRX10-3]